MNMHSHLLATVGARGLPHETASTTTSQVFFYTPNSFIAYTNLYIYIYGHPLIYIYTYVQNFIYFYSIERDFAIFLLCNHIQGTFAYCESFIFLLFFGFVVRKLRSHINFVYSSHLFQTVTPTPPPSLLQCLLCYLLFTYQKKKIVK